MGITVQLHIQLLALSPVALKLCLLGFLLYINWKDEGSVVFLQGISTRKTHTLQQVGHLEPKKERNLVNNASK